MTIIFHIEEPDGISTYEHETEKEVMDFLIEIGGEPEACVTDDGSVIYLQWDENFGIAIEGTTIENLIRAYENRCHRCDGNGAFNFWNHIKQGVCFRCGGTGIDPKAIS